MTDDSGLVLRWEIDNATAKCATGKLESEVFDKGGFKWTIIAEKDTNRNGKTNFTLNCDAGHNSAWNCNTTIEVRQFLKNGIDFDTECREQRFCFSPNSETWIRQCFWGWNYMAFENYINNDKIIWEFHINVISSESGKVVAYPFLFVAPSEMSNVILKIGDKKLHVSKEFLAVHSPVFKAIFFGNFVEKGKEEVELKDVVYEEILDLLNVIHFKMLTIADHKVVHILKLADRFQMKDVFNLAKMYLTQSNGFDVMAKLAIADQYNIADLKDECFRSFTAATELLKVMLAFPDYDKFSESMKAAICDRMKELKLQ